MGAILLECPICKRIYSVEGMSEKDGHICICGQILDKQTNYIGFCENASAPNNPLHVCRGDNSQELMPTKKLTKKVTIDVEAGKGFSKLLGVVKELSESIEDIPGLVMIDNNGKINVVPIISIDSKMIVFRTITPYRKCDREELAKEYTDKLGIKCEVIDARTELVAVIDG